MFDLLLLLIAVGLHAAGPQPDRPAAAATITAAAPAFLAPPSIVAGETAAVAPAFLSPVAPAPDATAAPAFLAPVAPARQAEAQTPDGRFTTATEVRPILAVTRGNWIHVRDFNGRDLLYVTHLWSWRCGLIELRVAINGAAPELWPLPECHLDQAAPNAILESDGEPYRSYPSGSIAMVEIALTYDDLTTETLRFNRQGMILP